MIRTLAITVTLALLGAGALVSAQPDATSSPAGTLESPAAAPSAEASDPYLWLEDATSPRALAWVRAENAKTLGVLQSDPRFDGLYADALKISQATDRIPSPEFLAGKIYNFWQDADHVRGIWRSTTHASYATKTPVWTTVLDLDALSKHEHANWVWEGADCTWPSERRCLIHLSDGGEDARTIREFDLPSHTFVPGGFVLPHGKQNVTWEDDDDLLVAREWTPGEMTASGYPYVVKRLHRGQPLSSAVEVFRGKPSDISASAYVLNDNQHERVTLIDRGVTFDWAIDGVKTESLHKQDGKPCNLINKRLCEYQDSVNRAGSPYNPFNNNSNGYANGASQAAGYPAAPPPVSVPGWNNLPKVAH